MSITRIHARQIFDSRGNPTVEVDLYTEKGRFRAAVPSGASTGIHEAVELRDGDKTHYVGKGVSKAVANVNNIIAPELIGSGLKVTAQKDIDDFLIKLDGTPNKGKLGANAILSVSIAVAEAAAVEKGVPLYQHLAELAGVKPPYVLPTPAFNVINGGSHAGNKLAFQEFMLLPVGASSFTEAMRIGTETYHTLKKVISDKYGIDAVNVGDEGGFAPNVSGADESLELLSEAIKKAGYEGKIKIALDVASSEFYKSDEGKYDLDFKNPNSDPSKWLTGVELADLTSATLRSTPSSLSRTPSTKMIGKLGPISPPIVAFRSSETTSLSPTLSVSRLPLRRRLAMASCLRSTRSEPSLSRFKLLSCLSLTTGVSWSLTDLVRQRTRSLPTLSLPSVPVRSRLVLLLVVSALPSIMLCFASRRNSVPTVVTPVTAA